MEENKSIPKSKQLPKRVPTHDSLTLRCPYCSKMVELTGKMLQYHREGRLADCPRCGRKIMLRKPAQGYYRDETGSLRKK